MVSIRKITVALVFISSVLHLSAMEVAEPEISVKNLTRGKLAIQFQNGTKVPEVPYILPNEEVLSIGNVDTLNSLMIGSYGRQKERLSFPKEVIGLVRESQTKYPGNNLILIVARASNLLGPLSWYNYEIKPDLEYVKRTMGPKIIWEEFASAFEAHKSKRTIEPHMILNIAKDSPKGEVQRAWQRDLDEWLKRLENADREELELIKKGVQFTNAAYYSLMFGGPYEKAFRDMVNNELALETIYTK